MRRSSRTGCPGAAKDEERMQPVGSTGPTRQDLARSLHFGSISHHPIWFTPRYYRLFEDSLSFAYNRGGIAGGYGYASDIY